MSVFTRLDLAIFHAINGASGHRALDLILTSVGANTLIRSIVLACPYLYLWFRTPPDPRGRVGLLAGLAAGALAVVIARLLALLLPFETRPAFDPASGFHPLKVQWGLDLEAWSAFPSDTAALCFALTLGLFGTCRRLSIAMSLISLCCFNIPRIYAGVHYPHDTLAGAIIALACVLAMNLPTITLRLRALLVLEAGAPRIFYSLGFLALSEETQMFDGLRLLVRALHDALRH